MRAPNHPIESDSPSGEHEFLALARKRFAAGDAWWSDNFVGADKDIAFAYESQWAPGDREKREGSSCLELNPLPAFIDQVVGDQRQNRPGIQVHPVKADLIVTAQDTNAQAQQDLQQRNQAQAQQRKFSNLAGTKDYSTAKVREGMIRAIEVQSNAETHYDIAFQHAVESGFGWLRVLTEYSDNDVFEQDLVVRSIRNRFSVIIDPHGAEDPDYATANWCFISNLVRQEEFSERWPDASTGSLGESVGDWAKWIIDGSIRVAEYFWRKPVPRTLLLLSDARVVWQDEVADVLDEMERAGIWVVRKRKVETTKVYWALITAHSILEGPIEVPFRSIPVVPVFGKEVTRDRYTTYRGLVRYAKDPVRMHNIMMSEAVDRVGLAPKSPYVLDVTTIEGFEQIWSQANRKNWGYLPYRHKLNVPPPDRQPPPAMPAAEMQLALAAKDEIKDIIGIHDASMGIASNETSGKAILARQRQGDRGTFAFVDNLKRAQRRVGKLLLDGMSIYDSERIVRIMGEDGGEDWVLINQTVIDQQTGKQVIINDLTEGKYDITVSTGPSYQTQRMEASDSLLAFVQAVPQAGPLIQDLLADLQDWPGADKLSRRLKHGVPPGVMDPQEMEDAGIQQPQPTPEQQAAMAKAEADTAMAGAKKAEAEAKMVELQMQQQVMQTGLPDAIKDLVAEAIAEFIAQTQGAAQQT